MKRFFLSGAHSTGKTTILNDLDNDEWFHNNIKIETEIARSIVKEWNISQNDLKNTDLFKRLQIEILKRQCEVDQSNLSSKINAYICDRGIDPLVYAKYKLDSESYHSVLQTQYAKQMIEILQSSITFAIKPHKECMVNDGVRYIPDWNDMLLYHKTLTELLDQFKIPYVEITELNREIRVDIIKEIIMNYFN